MVNRRPMVLAERGIRRLDDFYRGQGIFCCDQEIFFSPYGFRKVINLAAEGLNFIVAFTEDDPIAARGLTVLGLFPSDKNSPVRTVDIDVAVELLVDTPRKINSPHDTADATHENTNRVLYCQLLDSFTFNDLYLCERPNEITHEIDGMRSIVDQNSPSADF